VLGHTQRGGTPTAFDRVLATRYGIGAIDMVHKEEFGKMVALRGTEIVSVPLADAINVNRTVDEKWIAVAESLQEEPNHRPRPTVKKG
jgi:6-phosphofructokinase 1